MSENDKSIHNKQIGKQPVFIAVSFSEASDVQLISEEEHDARVELDAYETADLNESKHLKNLRFQGSATDQALPSDSAIYRHIATDRSMLQSKSRALIAKPRFEVGIILSAMLAAAGLIGASEPLHAIFLASGLHTPYIQNSEGFLDVFFILLATVIGYWGYCTFQIARAFKYRSNLSRRARLALTIVFALMNPAVLGVATLVPQFVIGRLIPHHTGVHGLGAHSAFAILGTIILISESVNTFETISKKI